MTMTSIYGLYVIWGRVLYECVYLCVCVYVQPEYNFYIQIWIHSSWLSASKVYVLFVRFVVFVSFEKSLGFKLRNEHAYDVT